MLLERLNRHPTLRARMESLLGVVEDAAGDLEKADAAERRVIEELRQMGNEALAAWAERGVEKSVAVARVEPDLRLAGKKLYWHTTFGKVDVVEPLWRNGTRIERRFSTRAGISCRGSSQPLQRVMSDFGADAAFGRVPEKLKEHYGIEMPVSTIQRITEHHAPIICEQEAKREIVAGTMAGVTFIGEMDGSMVPVVEISSDAEDKRKGKRLAWKEVRLSLVHPKGSVTPIFGGNFAGGVEESGRQWWRCAAKAGFGPGSYLHAVGDGASWIATQEEIQFGAQGAYLVDFFHLCEYLGEASKVCAANDPRAWLEEQKSRLKANQSGAVLEALAPFVETNSDDPATACDRYIRNRRDQLDYQGAIKQGLPIGSGEIESAHRYVIQERIKLPGAWWSPDHIETMLALRLNRANREWDAYWRGVEKEAA
ncbi:MAG: ISKra4 family transposase [Candidatus Accumulibacter cognatus]|uniref:ISKra4 family transposase n=1 Tax=Candidatus Accumulibacter cognatus TaxID=2954383 RepID=A0A7D5SJ56_9PROT|nr:MAG: ISKra4 family transposase [Candidatus Accumulibacter cognatus]